MIRNRSTIFLISLVSVITLIGILFTKDSKYFGILLGFITGIVNIQWLFRDSKKVINQAKSVALRIYFRSLFARLGMITLIVAAVIRFQPDWLLLLVLGIALGITIPLILSIRQQYLNGRG